MIKSYPMDPKKTVIFFSSPQAITSRPYWRDFFRDISRSGLLRLVCVDEVHLFVHYALSFRKAFALLSKVLFKHLKTEDKYCTKVTILFMTATCTVEIFEQVQSLTGIPFYQDKRNVFWPSPTGMANRSISIEVIYSSQTMKQIVEFTTLV